MARVRVVGYLSFDRLEAGGRTHRDVPGGAALYAALAARAEGADVSLTAISGSDWPENWLAALGARGIDVSGVARGEGPTRRARFAGVEDGPRDNAHHDDSEWWTRTAALAPPMPAALSAGDMVVAMPLPARVADPLVTRARACGARVTMDSSVAFARAEGDALRALVPRVDAFCAGPEETRALFPGMADDAAALAIARLGPDTLHKRGSAGAVAIARGGGEIKSLPAPPADVRETTGAGDATTGALAACLAAGLPFFAAAERALLAGARCVSGIGPAAFDFPPGASR